MILVIYDCMQSYTSELVRYLSLKDRQIKAAAFFEKEDLLGYCREQIPDILLVAEEILDDDVRNLKTGKLILLCESAHAVISEEEQSERMIRIGRYQSADEILSQLLLFCCGPQENTGSDERRTGGSIFQAFYAPAECPSQTELVWGYTENLRKSGSVLYLNLHENAGFSERFQKPFKRDFSDLLYLSQHRTGDFEMLLKSFEAEDEGVLYIPPMEQTTDAFLVSGEQWRKFLERMKYESGFEKIVFDLEFLFPAAYEILDLCEMICLLTNGTVEERNRSRHFMRVYEKRFGKEAIKKMREIRIS